MIQTWQQRCEEHPDHEGIVSEQMIRDRMQEEIDELRQALAEEALDRMVAENQRLGLYDEDNLQTAIEKGTKAWADVPDATEWVEELRGNDTLEVTTEVPCKTHPDAPHGFNRSASFDEDRYVCDCEFWEPDVDKVDMSEERVHKSDKSIHEPVAWADKVGAVIPHSHKLFQPALLKDYTRPLYTAPPKREWVGLTNEEIADVWKTEYFNISYELPRAVEAKLKEKNSTDWGAIKKELPAEAFGEQSPVWTKRF